MIRPSTRLRLGAVTLGACALLFAAFPLVRPFFDGVTGIAPALASIYRGPMTLS